MMDTLGDISKKEAKTDCRYFNGEKPCQAFKECANCQDYSPMGTRILIIKLAAGGDVLRTACLLPGVKKVHPISHITWLTQAEYFPLLLNHQLIDRLLPSDAVSFLTVTSEHFDILINLDKVQPAIALAEQVSAPQKMGFGMERNGSLRPLNQEAEYAYWLGLSDHLKFKENKKTYPQIIYEICGLEYEGQRYYLWLDQEQQQKSQQLRTRFLATDKKVVLGLNTGSGSVFATKRWKVSHWTALITQLHQQLPASLVLLGGPEEVDRNSKIMQNSTVPVFDTGTYNSLADFVTIVGALDGVVTSDTLAMHIALGLQKKVIVLLGPTSQTEIDVFDAGQKIVSDFDCSPCYLKECDKEPLCMDEIKPEVVVDAVQKILGENRTQ